MGAKKPLKYRELRRILSTFGISEVKGRGKGSHRIFIGTVSGQKRSYPTKCHNENDDKPIGVINALRRHFQITESDGVSDEDFYSR